MSINSTYTKKRTISKCPQTHWLRYKYTKFSTSEFRAFRSNINQIICARSHRRRKNRRNIHLSIANKIQTESSNGEIPLAIIKTTSNEMDMARHHTHTAAHLHIAASYVCLFITKPSPKWILDMSQGHPTIYHTTVDYYNLLICFSCAPGNNISTSSNTIIIITLHYILQNNFTDFPVLIWYVRKSGTLSLYL